MQWDDLRVFALSQAGSLRKAAGALRLGQPTIGRHLHQLELSVGARRRCPWVAYDVPHEYFRPMAWLTKQLSDRVPCVRSSRIALQLEAIRAGSGLWILPCFVGDADPLLKRLTSPIREIEADYWLLVHSDLKAVPRVRHVMERIRGGFKASRAALRG